MTEPKAFIHEATVESTADKDGYKVANGLADQFGDDTRVVEVFGGGYHVDHGYDPETVDGGWERVATINDDRDRFESGEMLADGLAEGLRVVHDYTNDASYVERKREE